MTKDRIVAVGLLTQRDLDVLGTGFHRLFPINDDDAGDDAFADLMAQLGKIDAITPDSNVPTSVARDLKRSS